MSGEGVEARLGAVLLDHWRGDWSDRTYCCQGCKDREEEAVEADDSMPVEEKRRRYHAAMKPDWTREDYAAHVAAALAAEVAAMQAEAVGAALREVVAVYERYFDLEGEPGVDDTTPEPEDVWRFDRDFRAALSIGSPS